MKVDLPAQNQKYYLLLQFYSFHYFERYIEILEKIIRSIRLLILRPENPYTLDVVLQKDPVFDQPLPLLFLFSKPGS